ncbi:uncharacterized protein Z519_08271 [Cladophialophora bantiana CBS 173.52]|uniref:Zn(II)2Cys6 transcription factor n=1 Tax=Cladophialophora bantiana (strain ATCC 10958 / CBS 173.52 / CDC B-1940 / NIH 8579) TaxID=1442370 RepID=A0A0D2HKT8_CLAB1|nr:uncharacterized protein Z519_08271 [Cladophialophora bantiana CBS 173.52]KIW91375.1 hypothetical protein Z519_08271 [Cladophialophora bantiana CBS 173.52]
MPVASKRKRRLSIRCVGLGQRRYKFVSDDRAPTLADSAVLRPKEPGTGSHAHYAPPFNAVILTRIPPNDTTQLVNAFTNKIKPTVGVQYNLAWTYGDYLSYVPARLGANEVLDSATDTFLAAVATLSDPLGARSNHVLLEKYGRTLASLRKCLDDPIKAKTSETLCAILFLWNCQQFIWQSNGPITTHADGVAQILRLRGCAEKYQDPFESNLLLSLRAVVLFDSLFNGRIYFSDQEWVAMFDNQLHELSPEGQAVQCLTRVPNLMRRSRAALMGDLYHRDELPDLQEQAHRLRADLEPALSKVRRRWLQNSTNSDTLVPGKPQLAGLWHCHFLRTYCLGLAIAIFINEARLALCLDAPDIVQESHEFALEILNLARMAAQYRPLGASAVSICLLAAELGAEDDETKTAVKRLRVEYARDFHGVKEVEDCQGLQLICGREWSRLLARDIV